MGTEETHALGYERVDDDPNISVLLATMDATAGWEATLRLRTWERDHLRLERGQRLLDVGCGLGDAGLALAADHGAAGELVGVDISHEMVAVARSRAAAAGSPARFSVGDAVALDEPDGSFDVVRAERTLQWITDPEAAVAEMARVGPRRGTCTERVLSMSSLADDLIDTGHLSPGDRQGFVSTIHHAARDDRFSMALTMFAVIARVPKTAS